DHRQWRGFGYHALEAILAADLTLRGQPRYLPGLVALVLCGTAGSHAPTCRVPHWKKVELF
ncbi:MAG TPA: hypothetical protein VJN64_01775, partial [Terriglobales bacterium]|nr:hypothetical protein [Terriglobales bacterium]